MSELAVRAVLLSAIQSVLSLARRRHGYLLTVDARGGRTAQSEDQCGIFQSFALLRARLLRCESACAALAELNPGSVLRPFLDLIRHEHTSSPLTSAALEAVEHFIVAWDWPHASSNAADVLSDIVDAVCQCRFQETSTESDQNVLVVVVQVLERVLLSPCATNLSDHSMWQLVESLYALSRANRNDPHITLALRTTATNLLHRAIEFIFQKRSVYMEPVTSAPRSFAGEMGFGLPCAIKIVGFLCQKLQPRGSALAASSMSSTTASLPTRREVSLSFSLLQRMLVACDAQLLSQVPSLMLFIKDDLCGAILRYCRLGASTDMKIPVTCLATIRLLWTKLRPMLKMQFEAIFNGIFCHTAHWAIAHLDLANPVFSRGDLSSSASPTSADFAAVDAVREEFTGELVPLNKLFAMSFEILDCLVDLLAEPTLLPDLYVNYDCDGNRSDLTHTLFDLLSQVVVQSHQACQSTNDEAHFLWSQAVGELCLRGLFNSTYVLYMRTQHKDSTSSEVVSNGAVPLFNNGYAMNATELRRIRQRKKLFQRGIQEFNRKPLAGIKYLQQNEFLPTPLNSISLAVFLRSLPPGLNKASVGVYLGAMGKEVKDFEKTDIHEADTMEFHRDVLRDFVQSFNFEGESIVAALRMFLASFRLPGEAQQIDRILNTFSQQVFEQCRDRFLMASEDVAYLLSFSLIMLNTDLHNPNIRSEKKMKLEDFIKNNRNYGEEVSRNQDLPDDFLTEIYEAIAKEEIKTREDDSKHGELTTDRWKDLLYQAESNPQNSRLITHQSLLSPTPTRSLRSATSRSPRRSSHPSPTRRRKDHTIERTRSTPSLRRTSRDAHNQSADELDESANLLDTSIFDGGNNGNQYDQHIYELVQAQVVQAFSSVFFQYVGESNRTHGVASTMSPDRRDQSQPPLFIPEKAMLQLACNGLVLCAAISAHHALAEDFNRIFVVLCKLSALYVSDVYPFAYNGRENGVTLFCTNQSAPVATAGMLKLVATCSQAIDRDSWKHLGHAINTLREFQALPDRLVYDSLSSTDSMLSTDESRELLNKIRLNREELERREALRAQELTGSSAGSSFFSGVAWLMSALDNSLTGTSSASVPLSPDSMVNLAAEVPSPDTASATRSLTPVDLASCASDLVVEPTLQRTSGSARPGAPSASDWIRQTLHPYRVDNLVDQVAKLPSSALASFVLALHEEVTEAFSGTHVVAIPKRQLSDSSRRRTSTFSGAFSSPQTEQRSPQVHTERQLSPAGCVFFEHLIYRITSAIDRDRFAGDMELVWSAFQLHFTNVIELVRPILTKNVVINGVGYDNAALVVVKALEGMISLALKSRDERALCMLTSFVSALGEMGGDDEVIRPYFTLILGGLKRIADAFDLRAVKFDSGEWMVISGLIGGASSDSGASIHAFALLEKLVLTEVWRADLESPFSLADMFTKTLQFALQPNPQDQLRWPKNRPIELLRALFEQLHHTDTEIEEEERLRQLGGVTVVIRRYLHQSKIEQRTDAANPDHKSHVPQVNESAIIALELLRQMVRSSESRSCLTGGAWLELLSSGLLVLGADVLQRKARVLEANERRTSDESGHSGPFRFYERNLPQAAVSVDPSHHLPRGKEKATTRQRRPSVVKDPRALRPHVLIVELMSWVACEQLDQLLTLPRFAAVWDELIDQMLAYIELTMMETRSGGATGEEVLMALERRSVLSAHEEIIEHVKSVIRRLTLLQHRHEQTVTTNDDVDPGKLSSARFHALMHVLVEKAQAKGPSYHEMLFPSKEDPGDITPPAVEESNASIFEDEATGSEVET